jgi:hypothetical protein
MEKDLTTWTATELPYTLRYSAELFERIQLAIAASPGGRNASGILLGHHSETTVTVSSCALFDFRHADGIGFRMVDEDRDRLAELLATSANDPEKQPVGWFRCVHGELSFSSADQALHYRVFPERWQVLLLLRPDKQLPLRATFFFLNCGSALLTGRKHEFVLQPVSAPPEHDRPDSTAAAADASATPAAEPSASETPASHISQNKFQEQPAELPSPRPAAPSEIAPPPMEQGSPAVAVAPERAAISFAPETPEPPNGSIHSERDDVHTGDPVSEEDQSAYEDDSAEDDRPRHSRNRRVRSLALVALGLAVLGAGAIAGYRTRHVWKPRIASAWTALVTAQPAADAAPPPIGPPASIRLVTIEENGQLQILWDPSLPLLQESSGGALQITDGAEDQTFPLDPTQMQTGSFTYTRASQRVHVVFTIRQRHGDPVVQATTYIGRSSAGSDPGTAATPGDAAPAREIARLKAELEAQKRRGDRLQQALEKARRDLGRRRPAVNNEAK